jgi:uncharacterized protein YciI
MAEPSLDDLLQRIKALPPVYCIVSEPTKKFPKPGKGQGATVEARDLLRKHYRFVLDLADKGQLLWGGPLDTDVGPGPALIVVRAASRADAEALASSEPYHVAGWRKNTVRSWVMRFGAGIGDVEKRLIHVAAPPAVTSAGEADAPGPDAPST